MEGERSVRPLRVLLVSPVRGVDPQSGDVIYTEGLLAHAPRGVEYVTYVEALERGQLIEHGRRRRIGTSRGFSGRDRVIFGARAVEIGLRRSGVAFREPFRYFSIPDRSFDLVHSHVFSIRLVDQNAPLVVSAACPLRLPYRDAWGWSPGRARLAEDLDDALGLVTGVNVFSGRTPQAYATISFSHAGGAAVRRPTPGIRRVVIPNGVDDDEVKVRRASAAPNHIGFIAADFDAKGGPLVLEAFELLRAERPQVRLTIVGSSPRLPREELDRRGITWWERIPRAQVLEEVLPSLDVFLYPTQMDGTPYVLIEAMGSGVPVVTSDYEALPEMVGGVGFVVTGQDAGAYARACADLLDPATNRQRSMAARQQFESAYRGEVVRNALGALYRDAVASWRAR